MAKAKVEEAPAVPTRAELEALATEMNEVMGLEPKIKFNRKTTDEALIAAIMENASDPDTGETAIYESDFEEDEEDPEKIIFTQDADATMEMLGIEVGSDEPAEEAVPEVKKTAKELKAEALAAEKTAAAAKETPKAGRGAKAAPAAKETPKAAPAKEKPAKAAKETKEKFTRYMSVAAVLKEGKALSEADLAAKSDDLYAKKGGNSGIAQAERIVDRAMQLLTALDVLEIKGGKVKYTA
jgi:hypothetical protein